MHLAHNLRFKWSLALMMAMFGLFSACEKEIQVDVPDPVPKLVIEGRIESDGITKTPPLITLSKSSSFFGTTSFDALANLQVHNAQVSITVDDVIYPLEELCVATLDTSFIPFIADFLGVEAEDLASFNFCVYTVPIADLLSGTFLSGEVGKTYHLRVVSEGTTYTSTTKIPAINTLNNVWYMPALDDTFGFAWANMADPDTIGDAYRWFAKRISHTIKGDQKDAGFIPPAGSAFDDKFINGLEFDFAYDRGHPPGDHSEEFDTELSHYFKKSDTIVIKFTTIDLKVYRFLRVFEIEISSAGSPFASPSTIPTNIEGGGLGLWAGYGVSYDTIYGVD